MRRRLDQELVRRRLARSRDHAAELIAAGAVRVNGLAAAKAATQVAESAAILVAAADSGQRAYASRGAHKLAGALDRLAQRGNPVAVEGLVCLDAGASTGGFCDVLLRRGASLVHAVDVGYGQLVWRLQRDRRIHVMDRTNVRHLTRQMVDPPPDLVTADLSFISLTNVIPVLADLTKADGRFLLMVKPQFEVGRKRLPAGGVVRDRQARAEAVINVAQAARAAGLGTLDVVRSPLPGPSGNVEFFCYLAAGQTGLDEASVVAAAVREAESDPAAAVRQAESDPAAGVRQAGSDPAAAVTHQVGATP
jgi:23S rRNA (cytidine1920-2'-O)/16S rRNA (cytidine1409-2'-O)-methyltransferase